jgi:hypothetical protein
MNSDPKPVKKKRKKEKKEKGNRTCVFFTRPNQTQPIKGAGPQNSKFSFPGNQNHSSPSPSLSANEIEDINDSSQRCLLSNRNGEISLSIFTCFILSTWS